VRYFSPELGAGDLEELAREWARDAAAGPAGSAE